MAYLIPVIPLILSVVMLIAAEFRDDRKKIYLWKPISTLMVIAVAALSLLQPAADPIYTGWLLLALFLSLVGDMALMFTSQRAFLIGLVGFLLAHVVYGLLFTALSGWQSGDWISGVVMATAGIAFYRLLWPHLGRMRLPVALYTLIICFMINRAFSTLLGDYFTSSQAWLIFGGALLFFVSDMILALNRFGFPFRYNRISLAIYYSGQLLLAMSASYFA